MRAAALAGDRPVEEGDVGAGARVAIGVEQVIRAGVVLVDRLLDQAQAERAGVEATVGRRLGGDRGQMMKAGKLKVHGVLRGLILERLTPMWLAAAGYGMLSGGR